MWLGEYDASSIVDFKFTTRDDTGLPTTLSGTPAVSVYKDNNSAESTTGITLSADFDSRTGLNHVRIDTSADGSFYAAGSDFQVVITTGTVDGVSVVGEVVGHFTIRNRAGLKPATAGRTLVVDASGLADANTVKLGPSGSGTAQTARDIGASVLVGTGGITSASFASAAIDAAAIAADAIGSAELAATATAEIADAVWDEAIAGHLSAGSTGESLNAASSAGDPWVTALPGAYAAGSAGFIVGANLDATMSSRASQTSVDTITTQTSAAGIRTAIGMATNDLDTQLDAILAATGGGLMGSGSITWVVTVQDNSLNPLDGAEVWVSTDAAGSNVVAGTLSTDAMGEATFLLDAGTYYLWVTHSGYNGTNPTQITVA